MKKTGLFLAVLAIVSCTNDKHQTKTVNDTVIIIKNDTINQPGGSHQPKNAATNSKQNLTGLWKEHWGVGVQTNVNTTDLYNIEVAGNGKISIISANKKNYKIDQVLFDGQEISFRKQNKSYPLGKFYVYYKLKIHDDFNWMEGPITNNKKQKDFVKWERVKP